MVEELIVALVPNRKKNLSNYWFNKASSLNRSAIILFEHAGSTRLDLADPCLLIAGLSVEVMAKAILVKKELKFDEEKYATGHPVGMLVALSGAVFTKDQDATIRLLEESVLWLGKYPASKGSHLDDSKFNSLFTKVSSFGNGGKIIRPNPKRWPRKDNYIAIWDKLYSLYFSTYTSNPDEFGYQLKGE